MFELFLRLACAFLLVFYLTESPDRLTKDEPAPWTTELLTLWQNAAIRAHTNDWFQIVFLYDYLRFMGLVAPEEHKRFQGFSWDWIYRRAVGRPLPYREDEYFGTREFHPPKE